MKDDRQFWEAPLSPARQAWLMLVVIAPTAACYPAIKAGLGFAPPLRFAGARTLLGGLVLLLALALRRKPLWPEARLARWILPLGVLATTLTYGAMFASPAYTGAGIASILGNTQPLIIIVLASLFLCEQITVSKSLALGLGLAGVILLALPALSETTGHPLLGAMLALGSSASAAVASVTMKRLHPGKDLMSLTGWQLVAGSVALLGLSAVFEPHGTISWTGGFVGLLLFLALTGTALSTWLWFWLLQRAEVGRLSLYLFLVPIFGLLIAMGGFGERLNALQAGGVALILLAVALSVFEGWFGATKRTKPPQGKPPTEPGQREHHRLRIDLQVHTTHPPDCLPSLATGREAGAILYTEGDDLYAAMIDSIANARHEVGLESYLFADDEVGRRFADVLAKRASAGVRVRLLLDAEGSRSRWSKRLARLLSDSGVEVRRFRPWRWGRLRRYWRRSHRKLLVVDDEVAYLGGFNIHRESSLMFYGEQRWRDSHVCLLGPLARQAAACFAAFWRRELDWEPLESVSPGSVLMPNQTRACMRRLRCSYGTLFAEARQSIQIATPYFVPDHRTQRGLVEAARRGVKVSLLVPRKSDVPIARWAARAAYAQLLAAGVRIYEYLPRMFHAKTAVIDGNWATIGTANMDYRSFFLNYELNLISRDEQLCRQLQAQFEQDLTESAEISRQVWAERKWKEYFFETIGWLSRRWL